jgi:membrane associated rhomboid family serine protease
MYQYLNNFTLSNYGLQRGYLHSLFFSHFTHMSLFTYLIDSVILYLFCQNLTMMHGPLFPAKVIILSIAVANALLLLQHS